ncbi:hypothetical protein [Pandoraea communis]|uniref:hypothetical protein n=1 Tax=Pandoraea communis TaxID=2508297 RepID=UPI0025A68249|nr:hypothetical protein [Pandoraea communis]MDM8356369.1 hypothetical protein [Pandoraea communis]
MPIYAAINQLKTSIPATQASAQAFLSTLPREIQQQLICAIYIGREHIYLDRLRTDMAISRIQTDHIDENDYARIIHEKADNITTYLDSLVRCANTSGFDLNRL